MAYTILRSNGALLTTIQDGTIDTVTTSLQLPGRNFAGYGQALDTNFVKLLENFASANVPQNPLKGQLWFNTSDSTMRVCPRDGETSGSQWIALTSTTSTADNSFGNISVTSDVTIGANLHVTHTTTSNVITATTGTISTLTVNSLTANVANLNHTTTQYITTGSQSTAGTLIGQWTVNGATSGNSIAIQNGNIAFAQNLSTAGIGIKCDNYYYANGVQISFSGTYTNGNVADFLTGTNTNGTNAGLARFTGNIAPTKVTTSTLAGGGNIEGIWTLATNARIQATYADLAERFEADTEYEVGTVVELGGEKEITEVQAECSEEVFGVVSKTAAFTMNGMAGDDHTHPAIAMSGRVPVKVIGKVKKGQRLVSAGIKGYARAATKDEMTAFNVIGRALENKTTAESGLVLAVVAITK